MSKIYYCMDCKRIGKNNSACKYCNGDFLKPIVKGTSVNVIGSKQKGKVLKIKEEVVSLILRDDRNNKFIKEFSIENIRKVL